MWQKFYFDMMCSKEDNDHFANQKNNMAILFKILTEQSLTKIINLPCVRLAKKETPKTKRIQIFMIVVVELLRKEFSFCRIILLASYED